MWEKRPYTLFLIFFSFAEASANSPKAPSRHPSLIPRRWIWNHCTGILGSNLLNHFFMLTEDSAGCCASWQRAWNFSSGYRTYISLHSVFVLMFVHSFTKCIKIEMLFFTSKCPTSGGVVTLRSGRREVPGSNPGRV